MAADKIQLEVVTPKGRALATAVDEVTAPSVQGEFGMLPGHVPLLVAIRTGIVTYRQGAETKRFAVGSGLGDGGPGNLVLLTDDYIERDRIDPVIVRKDLAEVQQELQKLENVPVVAADTKGGDARDAETRSRREALIARENWLAAQLELYGDPPAATQRPFEEFGPSPPPPDEEVPMSEPPVAADGKTSAERS